MTNLDVGIGTGEHGEFTTRPRAEICADLYRPQEKIDAQFVQCDAHNLPFRDKMFTIAHAHNILEHISYARGGILELQRVASVVIVVQDHIWHVGNYATPSHLHFQLPGLRFIKYPRTRIGIRVSKLLEAFFRDSNIKIGRFWLSGTIRYVLSKTLNSSEHGQYTMAWHDGKWHKIKPEK